MTDRVISRALSPSASSSSPDDESAHFRTLLAPRADETEGRAYRVIPYRKQAGLSRILLTNIGTYKVE